MELRFHVYRGRFVMSSDKKDEESFISGMLVSPITSRSDTRGHVAYHCCKLHLRNMKTPVLVSIFLSVALPLSDSFDMFG